MVFITLATAVTAAACGADPAARCGRGRYSGAGTAIVRSPSGGPYCLDIAAEGVGTLSLQVNPSGGSRSVGEDGQPVVAQGTGQLTYALTQAPASVSFIDVCATGGSRRVLPSVDDSVAQIPEPDAPRIPFPIRVYDVPTTQPYTVASNGWLSFLPGQPIGPLSGAVPTASAPNLLAAPYWTDLVTRTGVCYGTVGSAPNRAFVVQWEDMMEYGGGGPNSHLTFEIIVREIRAPLAHNVIDFVYQRLDGAARPNPGAGLENADGTVGTTVPQPLTAPRALRFTPSR